MDIDIDICPSKRPEILRRIREERGHMMHNNVTDWAKNELGCTLIATFGTESTKSAILTACRGYRTDDYKDGIDVDEAQYLSSLVPQERGLIWSISDVVDGNPSKGRKPIKLFINEISKYPGLLEIIRSIEGLVSHRGSHASGIILFDNDPFERCAFMKTPSGDLETQFDLHASEWLGLTKYDFLVTDVQDKLVQAILLMQKDNVIDSKLTLRQVYDMYFHPNVLPLQDEKCWKALANGEVLNVFQFESMVGNQVTKKLKPSTILELSDANGLMRLMGEEGEERPLDKYFKQKNNIQLWYNEMDNFGLTKIEQKVLEPYFKPSYGVPPDQESLMYILMDKDICNFSVAEANDARGIVGKKKMDQIPALHAKVLERASSDRLGQYVWKYGLGPQMGYAFSRIHALAYSFIGFQTLYIATHWNPVYWNTACLIVNSGAIDPETSGTTDYSKTAKALGAILNAGIKVSLPDINNSDFSFKPDVENNQILYGLKAMLNVGDELISTIIDKRPYASIKDFYYRVKPNKQAMISLIKGGAFDKMEDRKFSMAWYLWETCDKKQRLTLQNMGGLIKYNLLPENTDEQIMARRVYEFNRYIKATRKSNFPVANCYNLDERSINFLTELGKENLIQYNKEYYIEEKVWNKVYQEWMDIFRQWINENKQETLFNLNKLIFKDAWNKYALGNYSSWEMEALCFYYHTHELAHANKLKYGIVDFFKLPTEPIIDRTFSKGGKTINLFKLYKICGTCIAKNKVKSTVSLLTDTGVVEVKFRKEYFALFDKQISQRGDDGIKHTIEKSWFNRGSMIMVTGIRSEDMFISKKYASTGGHQLYKIDEIRENGELVLRDTRRKGEAEDED